MSYRIHIQKASSGTLPIKKKQLKDWITQTLLSETSAGELVLRIVDEAEIQYLNKTYRAKDKATNVLAFPAPETLHLKCPLLGDIIICPAILKIESQEQDKSLEAHWAHIVIHGVLHLLGFDHIEDADEKKMQAKEIKLLQQLGFPNPYIMEEEVTSGE